MPSDLYVQYGCGFSAPPGWRSFDASPTLTLQRLPLLGTLARRRRPAFPARVERGDIVRGLPIAPSSCQGIYASHVLEHLALEDARTALVNTLQLLTPGGIFRLIVPDLECYASRYLEAAHDGNAAHRFMEDTLLGTRTRPRTLASRASGVLGNARHLWMWDHASMSAELEQAGFVDIRTCVGNDCEDPRFAEVEDPDRFVDAIALQCRRA